jgi:hypothetical protein
MLNNGLDTYNLRSSSSWEELKDDFLKFWVRGSPLDQYLSEFSAMKRQSNETIFIFSRRFSNLYYKMPKRIQPSEVAAMLCYATTFHPNLSFLLMERRSKSLQQMFSDAHEVEDNLRACGKFLEQIQNEELDVEEHGSECEQKVVDLNFEQKINNIMHFLEVFNVDAFAKKYISPIQEEVVDLNCFASGLNFDPSQDKQGVDYFMYSFENFHENELVDHPTEEQVDVSRFFLVDDIADVDFFPRYDEYNDDYDIDFLEQPTCMFSIKKCSVSTVPWDHSACIFHL